MGTMMATAMDVPHVLLLHHSQSETVGKVIRQIPESHGSIDVGYSVGGTSWRQAMAPHRLLLPVREGETVRVYYYPRDPAIAFAAPAEELLTDAITTCVFGSLLGALIGFTVALYLCKTRSLW